MKVFRLSVMPIGGAILLASLFGCGGSKKCTPNPTGKNASVVVTGALNGAVGTAAAVNAAARTVQVNIPGAAAETVAIMPGFDMAAINVNDTILVCRRRSGGFFGLNTEDSDFLLTVGNNAPQNVNDFFGDTGEIDRTFGVKAGTAFSLEIRPQANHKQTAGGVEVGSFVFSTFDGRVPSTFNATIPKPQESLKGAVVNISGFPNEHNGHNVKLTIVTASLGTITKTVPVASNVVEFKDLNASTQAVGKITSIKMEILP